MYNKHSNDAPHVTFLKGRVMGAVEVIPAASGSTVAFVLGIYGRMLAVIKALDWHLIEDMTRVGFKPSLQKLQPDFVVPLIGGAMAGLGVMVFVIGLPDLVRQYPQPVYGLFFGLIAASVMVLLRHLPSPWHMRDALYALAGGALGGMILVLVPTTPPDGEWFYVVCGALAVLGLLLPGVSGAFVLVILGKYEAILTALSTCDADVLMPFALGCGIGLAAFARCIHWLLERHYRPMMLGISGLLVATLIQVWPFSQGISHVQASPPDWVTYMTMLIGCALLWAMEWCAGRKEVTAKLNHPPH